MDRRSCSTVSARVSFSERAIAFVEREHLPGNIVAFKNVAYFSWRLFPIGYRD
jgi:hypothetical protein